MSFCGLSVIQELWGDLENTKKVEQLCRRNRILQRIQCEQADDPEPWMPKMAPHDPSRTLEDALGLIADFANENQNDGEYVGLQSVYLLVRALVQSSGLFNGSQTS